MNKVLLVVLTLLTFQTWAQNASTLADCQKFKDQIAKDGIVQAATLRVPVDYSSANSPQMDVFYWIKKGTDPNKVPVLLIHGGPGANSWRYYSVFKDVKYTGDIVAMDNRNEGCSHIKAYNDHPATYRFFRARSIVKDLENLRKKLYGDKQWRIFGQSRGGPIAHYYLEMFPQSLESVQTHGFAMMTPANTAMYTYLRSLFNVRASDLFVQMFPDAGQVILQAKAFFESNKICVPVNMDLMNLAPENQPRICGQLITDGISYRLSNYSKWPLLNQELLALRKPDGTVDPQKAVIYFQNECNGNVYVGYMNYILGTNAQDISSPSPQMFPFLLAEPKIQQAVISEGRFVAQAVFPAYLTMGFPPVAASVDPFDFAKVKNFLLSYEKAHNGAKFPLVLFSSYFDTVGGPEMYNDEKNIFGDYVRVYPLKNSGHEGWSTEKELVDYLFR